jgi:hypothetical protein
MNVQCIEIPVSQAGSVFEHCRELLAQESDKEQKQFIALALAACEGHETLRQHLNVPQSKILDRSDLLDAVGAFRTWPAAASFASMVCGTAGCVVHRCFIHANQRKIMNRVLIDYQLTQAKLADLAANEAVLCLRHKILFVGRADVSSDNLKEICRCALQISALALELVAGTGFVRNDATQSDLEILLLLVTSTLGELAHAQHA